MASQGNGERRARWERKGNRVYLGERGAPPGLPAPPAPLERSSTVTAMIESMEAKDRGGQKVLQAGPASRGRWDRRETAGNQDSLAMPLRVRRGRLVGSWTRMEDHSTWEGGLETGERADPRDLLDHLVLMVILE